jgi:Kyakuja-Dileera-Zisupton transposase
MDYIFLSAVMSVCLGILLTYDIACQWTINFKQRMQEFPQSMQLRDEVILQTGVPKFHMPAHPEKCQVNNSLNIKPGVGRTDGEGIERSWSEINPIAPSTKEMGPGSYHDTLDDHFGHHNWRKYVMIGKFHDYWQASNLQGRLRFITTETTASGSSRARPAADGPRRIQCIIT